MNRLFATANRRLLSSNDCTKLGYLITLAIGRITKKPRSVETPPDDSFQTFASPPIEFSSPRIWQNASGWIRLSIYKPVDDRFDTIFGSWKNAGPHSLLFERLQPNVLVLGPHRFASMKLQGEHAFEQSFVFGIGEFENQTIVEVVLNTTPLANDGHVIPIVQVKQLFELFGGDQRFEYFLLSVLLNGLFADHANPPAIQTFAVDETADIRKADLVADFMLVSTDDPVIASGFAGNVFGTVLDAGVVGGVAAERQTQFEILGRSVLPDQERITLGRVLGGRLAVNDTIADRPETRITVPSFQILAVEQRLESSLGFGGGRRRRFGRRVGESESQS